MRAGSRTSTDLAIPALTLIAVAQVMVLLYARGGAASTAFAVDPGYDFGQVELLDQDSLVTTLGRGEPTIVLVFHSGCAHCEAVAPAWRAWLQDAPPDLAVLALSRERYASALDYAKRHHWDVAVRTVRVPTIGSQARTLVRLTPWVYALDGDGRVILTGHGTELDRIGRALQEIGG